MTKACIASLLLSALPVLAQTAVIPSGNGTADAPYRIAELGHLVWMGSSADASAGSYYALQNDIEAAVTATWNDADTDETVLEGFRPIGTEAVPFAGDFDGQGHVIRGLTVDRPDLDGVGLFGWIRDGGAVRHLGLEGGSVTGRSYVGGLLGHNNGANLIEQCYATGRVAGADAVGGLVGDNYSGTLTACYATGAVSSVANYVGGLAGLSYDTVEQCYATGMVTGAGNYVGGLVGLNHSTVEHCYATGAVRGTWYVGGLLGDNYFDALTVGTVTECYATGVTSGESYVGGLVGFNCRTVEQCNATGPVTGESYVGGLVGYNYDDSTVEQCQALGDVTGGTYVGGLTGYNCSGGTLEQCSALGVVTGQTYVGGLAAYSAGTLTGCSATGAVRGATYYVGGLAGRASGVLEQCYATGVVSGDDAVGGLLGDAANGCTVTQCYATGPASGVYGVGGLLGYNNGTLIQCFATGPVTGTGQSVGGLVGNNYGSITQCYASGRVLGTRTGIGGLLGNQRATVTQCYWDTETSGWATSAAGTGAPTAQMLQQSTYVDWDFAGAWDIVAGQSYPFLQWSPPPFVFAVVARGPGAVSADPVQAAYEVGDVVALQAVAAGAHAEFVRWLGPVASATAAQTTVTVPGPLTVVGVFRVARAIASVPELQKIGRDPEYPLDGRYWLTHDLDATATATWNDAETTADLLEGFAPIGTEEAPFVGEFDGKGFAVLNLMINRPTANGVGLFGWLGSVGVLRNLGVEGGAVTGWDYTGGLLGDNVGGTVENCHAAAAVAGYEAVGGLVGYNDRGGTVRQSLAAGAVEGDDSVGGLVGSNWSIVVDCHAAGAAAGGSSVGGLVGYNNPDSLVARCFATGAVSGRYTGGLVGGNYRATIRQCYATGTVSSTADYSGGLVGTSSGTVEQCYATGAVSGRSYVGGLAGNSSGTITQCYATGMVTGTGYVSGGLVGSNTGAVGQCYWDTATSGWTTSAGGDGRTSAEMRQASTYVGWDFAGIWGLDAGPNRGYPYLRQVGPWALQLLAGVEAAELDWGRRLWDVTGTYPTTLAGDPLTLNLVHDGAGRITGTAVLSLTAGGLVATPLHLSVRGGVTGADGALQLRLTLAGADSARRLRVALNLALALDVDARQLSGAATGSLSTAAETLPLADTLTLDLPADMDGTWALLFHIAVLGRTRSGTAALTLANGVEHLLTATGRSSGSAALVLRMSLAGTDPAARGITMRAAVTPLGGGGARFDAMQAQAYGQALNW